MGIETEERAIDKTELFIAEEVFLSGTAAKVTPVKQIENFHFASEGIITEKIKAKLTAITNNKEPKYQDWIYTVDC
jgi:branched-chain amino acid aminotransferase